MTKLSILVVDDEKWVAENLKAYLEDEGYTVYIANHAEQALILLHQHIDIKICIMDIRLPTIDGNQCILTLQQHQPSLQYIIYTGCSDYVLPNTLLDIGIKADQVFYKPLYKMHNLLNCIIKLCGKKS